MGTGSSDLRCVNGPYAFVGDLHGRVNLLRTILSKDVSNKYHYVFLGDILHHKPYFRRTKRCSPVKILKEVSQILDEGRGTLILGNNENYVLDALIMPGDKISKKELKYTLECLRELPLNQRLKYISMLSNAPLHLEIENKYRVAHAYYPHHEGVPREHVIAGPGYAWFRDTDLSSHLIDPNFMYLFGHYGLPYRHQNVHILDATSLEATGVYYSDKDEMVIYY